jgi:hypothetical protein
MTSPQLSNTGISNETVPTPSLTPHASALYIPSQQCLLSTPMSQSSLSQTSETTPYTDMDMYGQGSNYMDQVTNGYSQMNINQVLPLVSPVTKNAEYTPYVGVSSHSGQHYDPMTDMYFQAPTNYQPVRLPPFVLSIATIPSIYIFCTKTDRSRC